MTLKTLFKTVPIFSFLFNCLILHAQNNETIYVKPLKSTYEWNEKVIVEFSGLPARDTYSGRFDDVIIVPAGTPDDKYNQAQRVYATKPNGQAEFTIPKAGRYEARVYIYEKPGVVSARSSTFQVLSVEEGALESKSDEALVQIAMRNRSRNKELMCGAISEYLNRKTASSHPNYTGMKALQSLCPKPKDKPRLASTAAVYPATARYQCYRLMNAGNEVAEDIVILEGYQYKTMNKVGKYLYDPKSRTLTFTSGPLYLPVDKWIGVYTARAEPTGNGGRTVDAIIEIRRKTDFDAGNKKVLQQCTCVQ